MTTDEFQSQIESDFDEKQMDILHEEFQLKHNDFMGDTAGQPDIPEPTAIKEIVIESDVIKPSHYKFFGYDTMPMIEGILGTEGYLGFLKGSSLKYRLRCGKKKGNSIEQDIAKAMYYEKLYDIFMKENTFA